MKKWKYQIENLLLLILTSLYVLTFTVIAFLPTLYLFDRSFNPSRQGKISQSDH